MMQLSDGREIRAERETVWTALLDPEVLKACIPGCTEMTGSPEEGFTAVVTQKVGPVKATFKGRVSITDMVPREACTILGEGMGGPAGFAKGGARIRLSNVPEGTRLDYDVEAKVGGKLAQLGSRIIDGFAKKMADDFFTCFSKVVEGPEATETLAAAEPEVKRGWLSRLGLGAG